jgi:hypothetical protein
VRLAIPTSIKPKPFVNEFLLTPRGSRTCVAYERPAKYICVRNVSVGSRTVLAVTPAERQLTPPNPDEIAAARKSTVPYQFLTHAAQHNAPSKTPAPGASFAGEVPALKSERHFGPGQDQIAVEKLTASSCTPG